MLGQIWSSLSSLGAGLIFFAVAAGAEWWIAAPLAIAATAEIVFGLGVLRAGRILAPRLTIAGGGVATLLALALLFTGRIGFVPAIAVIGFHWGTALCAAILLRRSRAGGSSDAVARARPGAFAGAMTVTALVVAAVTTPALANTGPGEFALPHGEMHQHH